MKTTQRLRARPAFSICGGRAVPELPASVVRNRRHVDARRASRATGEPLRALLREWRSVYARVFA